MVTILWIVLLAYSPFIIEGKLPTKIINGKPASIVWHSYHVSLLYQNHYMCSGSIVSLTSILTTSSCIFFESAVLAGNIRVVSGRDDRYDNSRGQVHNVRFIISHEEYQPGFFWKHDISILKLESPIISFNAHQLIQLPKSVRSSHFLVAVCGWGNIGVSTNRTGEFLHSNSPRYLNVLDMKVLGREMCWDIFDKYGYTHFSQQCATAASTNGAVTWGDGGGAVIDVRRLLFGIISILKNQQKSTVIIFTRVPAYIQWIKEKLSKY